MKRDYLLSQSMLGKYPIGLRVLVRAVQTMPYVQDLVVNQSVQHSELNLELFNREKVCNKFGEMTPFCT